MSRVQRIEVIYSGNVQGVGFRFTVRSIAAGAGVTGYVKNMPDGTVFVVAEAGNDDLADFLEKVGREMKFYIQDTRIGHLPATGEFGSFDIRF